MKFKAGDVVVIVNHNVIRKTEYNSRLEIGTAFVINDSTPCNGIPTGATQVCFPKRANGYFDTELEFESIYNSPLYSALR